MSRQAARPVFGFNVYGPFGTPCGLSVAARNTVELLKSSDVPYAIFDVAPDGHLRSLPDASRPEPFGVNLFHLNPNWLDQMLSMTSRAQLSFEQRLNVCVVFWELPRFTRSWIHTLECMDLVLAPSTFVQRALVESGLTTPVSHYSQAAFLPDVRPNRERFGIDADSVVFCMSFGTQSGLDRKNPWATLKAFDLAFPSVSDVRLAVRVHAQGSDGDAALLDRLHSAMRDDPRILLIEGDLSHTDVLSLYASSDAYVSLHRSEGLGLGPMEAMSLGKPVVATNWSGNLDFMSDGNSLLVLCKLVPIERDSCMVDGFDSDETGLVWAEPSVEDAAAKMRSLYDSADLRARLGQRANDDMAAARARALDATFLDDVRDALQMMVSEPHVHRARFSRLLRLQAVLSRRRRYRAMRRGLSWAAFRNSPRRGGSG